MKNTTLVKLPNFIITTLENGHNGKETMAYLPLTCISIPSDILWTLQNRRWQNMVHGSQPGCWIFFFFRKQSFIGTQPCPYIYIFSKANFVSQLQKQVKNWDRIHHLQNLLYLLSDFLQKKFPHSALNISTCQY